MPDPDDADEAALLESAIGAFDSGDYYAAHDLFEALWGEDLYKGLVQASVALHHYSVGNLKGLRGLPENVERLLAPYAPTAESLDVARFLADFGAFFAAVRRGESPRIGLAPRLHRTGQP